MKNFNGNKKINSETCLLKTARSLLVQARDVLLLGSLLGLVYFCCYFCVSSQGKLGEGSGTDADIFIMYSDHQLGEKKKA